MLLEEFFHLLLGHCCQHMMPFVIKTFLHHFIELTELVDALFQHVYIVFLKLNPLWAPLLTNPTLASVLPDTAVLDVVATQHPCEDDFTHVVSHRISEKQIVCNLIDPDEKEGYFSWSLVLGLGERILLHSLLDSFNFETVQR
jgi:hypothetical protein